MQADEFINALKQQAGIKSDEDLAKKLGVGKSTLSSWRRRGAVPSKAVLWVSAKLNIDPSAEVLPLCRLVIALTPAELDLVGCYSNQHAVSISEAARAILLLGIECIKRPVGVNHV